MMLQIFGEVLLLIVGQSRRDAPPARRADWRRPKGTPRLG
jgi:hypothetical protein